MSKTTLIAGPAEETRNIILLSVSQAIVGSQQSMIVAVGALVGATLAPSPAYATLPATSMVLGLALTTSVAAAILFRWGRRTGFIFGTMLAVVGALLAVAAIVQTSFVLFCTALAICGASAAFGQQYRFAAADAAGLERKSRAISLVLAGGVVAGFVGPGLSFLGRNWIAGAEYAGSFMGLAGLALIGTVVLSQTRLEGGRQKAAQIAKRRFGEIVRSPDIFVPILTGMASYGLMTFVMVAAPLAMVYSCGLSKDSATFAIQWHVIAMYLPSFFTGKIINRLGTHLTTAIGLLFILGSVLVSLNGITELHFDFALILLGVGWNFGFIGSTTMLAIGYRPDESARVQGLNDQLVFGTMAVASISSGLLLQTISWQSINILAIPIATAAMALLAFSEWRSRQIKGRQGDV